MSVAGDVATWIRDRHQPAAAKVYEHRRPADFGAADALIVSLERQDDGYLFGGGLGLGGGGLATIRLGLWYVVNRRRDVAGRTPETALDGLAPVYEALLDVRRETIGAMVVRHVEAALAPVLRSTDAADEIAAYARLALSVGGAPP